MDPFAESQVTENDPCNDQYYELDKSFSRFG